MRIRHSQPMLGVDEDRAVCRVLSSGHVARGAEAKTFERELSARLGVPHVRLASSGTAALHAAIRALGIGSGDEVALPSFVCAAVLHAIRHSGAAPVPADIDPGTLGLTPEGIRAVRTPRLRAIVVVHPFGRLLDLAPFREFGVPLIEDLAMALGAQGTEGPAGSLGTVSICSFYATKMITTGHGGCIGTASDDLARAVDDLLDYDERDSDRVRFNYSMSDVNAAIGRAQLARLDGFLAARRALASIYRTRLARAGVDAPDVPPGASHVFYRYVVRIRDGGRDAAIVHLREAGIEAKNPVYRPVHRYLNLEAKGFAGAESVDREALSLPIHPGLAAREVEETADRLLEFLHEA